MDAAVLALMLFTACAPQVGSVRRASSTSDIQEQIDAAENGGVVHLSTGVYEVSDALILRDGVTVRGDGIGRTVLLYEAGEYAGSRDVFRAWDVDDVALESMTIDGNRDLVTAGEQSHGLSVIRSARLTVDRVEFKDTVGDGIKLIGDGADGKPTDDFLIAHGAFRGNGRNGVTIQRNVTHGRVIANTFDAVAVQSIDFEPGGAIPPSDITMSLNNIRCSHGGIGVTLSGISQALPSRRLTFSGNTLDGCYLQSVWMSWSTIANNTIHNPGGKGIDLWRDQTDVTVSANNIEANYGIRLQAVTSGEQRARRVTLIGNVIVTDFLGIVLASPLDVSVVGNSIYGSGPAGIAVNTDNLGARGVIIAANSVHGFDTDIRMATNPEPLFDVSATGNSTGNGVTHWYGTASTHNFVESGSVETTAVVK